MLEKPSYEFHAADSHGLCLPAIPVILVFKRHCAVIISSDAAVGYGGPVRIPGKIAYSIASAVEGLLYKWQPSFFKERIDEGLPRQMQCCKLSCQIGRASCRERV